MRFEVPVYVRQDPGEKDRPSRYRVEPLFVTGLSRDNEKVSRALSDLARDIRKSLREAAGDGDEDELLSWSFSPDLKEHRLKIPVRLRRREPRCRFLFVTFRALDRKLAFTPSVPEAWFEIHRGETLADRAAEVLGGYFRELEKNSDEEIRPEDLAIPGKAYLTTLEIEITRRLPAVKRRRSGDLFAALFSEREISGEVELERVGDCLDWLYPDDLDRATLREPEVAELTALLADPDRRPVLLLGPRRAGKTALVHEYVYRQARAKKKWQRGTNNVWHISPQRLISGMSAVGEWENRLLAILKEARQRKHIIYFDDLLGLYLAGLCADSSLSAAQVLKPRVEAREFRLLAEATPEAFRVLQERDRGFADLFHVIRVRETGRDETLKIMIAEIRRHEELYNCRFELDALPAIIDLQGRFVRDSAFPGKAAAFAGGLALKRRRRRVDRSDVLEEFRAATGLPVDFFDGRLKLERTEIEAGLRAKLIGQENAVRTLSAAICRAKARLNDPDRPLGAFLFIGPTGVGKTECAKAAADYLYGDPGRLVRFDMNEFSDPRSAVRLVGTFHEPEGLLTAEIRRRPFCVLLLDEIEKAHPDVFDLLLQVLGEGRLTDALGRTADFRNALIILTSNLGARAARSRLGFRAEGRSDDEVYAEAARKFFAPEFFNRLDRVVPFSHLTRPEIGRIANRVIGEVMSRHGLRQRKCVLEVEESAMDRLVEAGFHPRLGARALKRIVERHLAQPVADRLAGLSPGVPTLITALAGPEAITTLARGLVDADPLPRPAFLSRTPAEVLEAAAGFLERAGEQTAALEPTGAATTGKILPEHDAYFALREQIRYLENLHRRAAEQTSRKKPPALSSSAAIEQRMRARVGHNDWDRWDWVPKLQELMAADSVRDALRELEAEEHTPAPGFPEELRTLVDECALLEAMLRRPLHARVLFHCRSRNPEEYYRRSAGYAAGFFHQAIWTGMCGFHCEELDPCSWVVSGPAVEELLRTQAGTQLIMDGYNITIAHLRAIPLSETEEPAAALEREEALRREWLEKVARGEAVPEEDPFLPGPVNRVIDPCEPKKIIDYRTGFAGSGPFPREIVRRLVLGLLPLPPEMEF